MKKLSFLLLTSILILGSCGLFQETPVNQDAFEPNEGPLDAGIIVLDTTYKLSIHTNQDADWFKIPLGNVTDELLAYKITTAPDFTEDNDVDTYLRFIAPNGADVLDWDDDSGYGSYSEIITTNAGVSDNYFIKVNSTTWNTMGYYTLNVTRYDGAANAINLTLGVTKNGVINFASDLDYYSITLVSNTSYTILVNELSTNTLDVQFAVWDVISDTAMYNGLIDDNGDLGETTTFTALDSGTHFIKVSSDTNGTGNYQVIITQN